ncbi:MAG: alpha/beta hydrolase [Syntrophomonadaceae bacterium]|nr:alpha/beta hydrolase [Syntrophomonadaceae bacterium]
MKEAPVFKSESGWQAIMAGYDEILGRWPIPYESIMVPTRHGLTHIIACGKKDSPPLLLLHGSSSNATMWIRDVKIYAEKYRVYAVDLPGEPGKSEPVRSSLHDWNSCKVRRYSAPSTGKCQEQRVNVHH